MEYLDFLERLHAAVQPEAYLEIGLRHGDSLALASCPSLGVDPAFNLKVELGENVTLLRETSDEYFGRKWPLKPLGGRRVDMAFIDGMHLSEFALRDFMGVEQLSRWTGVAIFDDILPRTVEEANRDRRTRAWTGDVYKVLRMLECHRPDLICLRVGTKPTGLLLVLASRVWPVLRDLRDQGTPRRSGLRDLRRAAHRDLGRVSPGPLRRLLPSFA